MPPGIFDILLLTGRPASGKSEVIDYLVHLPADERRARFHLGDLQVFDDFPMLWTWFEEDALLTEKFNLPRLHTDERGYFKFPQLWHLLIERLGMEYQKARRDQADYHLRKTALIEFSRGSEHGGYREALSHLPPDLLARAGLLYVQVSFDESRRKNRRRFNPQRPDSILEHGLSDEKMERLYREDDWQALTAENPRYLQARECRLPYAVFENEDDVTTGRGSQLGDRLEQVLNHLWQAYQER